MKNITLTIILAFSLSLLMAQQDAQYTQFMFNKLSFNPAYAGSAENVCLSVLYRKQWSGLEGAPKTSAINFHHAFAKNKRIGLGLTLIHDKIGPTNSVKLALAYAYRIPIKKGVLSFGMQGVFRHYTVDWKNAKLTQAGDNLVGAADNYKTLPNAGLGIYYESEKWFMGLSVPQLIKGDLSLLNNTNNNAPLQATEENHVYAMLGAMFKVSDKIDFKPSMLIKHVKNVPFDMDINASFLFVDRFWAGLTYRLGGSTEQGFGESIDLVIQYHLKNSLKIGFAYDITLSEINRYSNGTIEVLVEYCAGKNQNDLSNPRFF